MKYEVEVSREGKWWMVSIPAIHGLTQARRLSEADQMAKEFIAVTNEVPIGEVDVHVVIAWPEVTEVLGIIEHEREEAQKLERAARERTVGLAIELVHEGIAMRDVGTILGVSHQRVHQYVSAGPVHSD